MVNFIKSNKNKEALCPKCFTTLSYGREDVCHYDLNDWYLDKADLLSEYKLAPLNKGVIICPVCISHFEVDEPGGFDAVCDLFNEKPASNRTDFINKVLHFNSSLKNHVLHLKYDEIKGTKW